MHKNLSITFFLLILISCSNNNENTTELKYPESKKIDFTESLHGYEISDSYRWLEDFTSEESIDWIERQNLDYSQCWVSGFTLMTVLFSKVN